VDALEPSTGGRYSEAVASSYLETWLEGAGMAVDDLQHDVAAIVANRAELLVAIVAACFGGSLLLP